MSPGSSTCTALRASICDTHVVTVPVGVTVHDWVALPLAEVVAFAVKLLEIRDSTAVGSQLIVPPVSVTPEGAAVNEKVTVPPEGSVAANL